MTKHAQFHFSTKNKHKKRQISTFAPDSLITMNISGYIDIRFVENLSIINALLLAARDIFFYLQIGDSEKECGYTCGNQLSS